MEDAQENAALRARIRELEERLDRANADDRFRLVVESAPNGIVVADEAGTIVMVNERAEQQFGYPRDEFVGLSIEQLVPERYRSAHGGLRSAFHRRPEPRAMGAGRDLYAVRRDGSEFPVEIALTPIPRDGGMWVLSSIVDITERKQAQATLQLQAEILGNVHDAVFYVDEGGVVRDWNEGAARIFGVDAEEAIGSPLEGICPARGDGHPFTERIVPAIEERGVAEELIQCERPDGGDLFIRAKVTRMDEGGRPGYVFCASDITKEKQLEAELVRASEKEQRRIGQDIHDDLSSQLSGIGCLAKVLEQRLESRGAEEAEEAELMARISGMVADAGVRAREIARGLVPTVLETRGLAGALHDLAQWQQQLRGIECGVQIEGEEALDRIGESISIQLYRVVQEAVANAMKHSDADHVEISAVAENGHVELAVSDDGKGMAGDSVSAGMGMLTMRRRAEIIGADFDIEASPGEGTRIRCALPASDS